MQCSGAVRRSTRPLTEPFARSSPALIALSKQGRLLAVEATGEVTWDGKVIASGDCHFAWFTEDETDLGHAPGSIVTTLTAGRVRLSAPATHRVRAYGWDSGGMRLLEEMAPEREGEWLTIEVDEDLARQVIALGEATIR